MCLKIISIFTKWLLQDFRSREPLTSTCQWKVFLKKFISFSWAAGCNNRKVEGKKLFKMSTWWSTERPGDWAWPQPCSHPWSCCPCPIWQSPSSWRWYHGHSTKDNNIICLTLWHYDMYIWPSQIYHIDWPQWHKIRQWFALPSLGARRFYLDKKFS